MTAFARKFATCTPRHIANLAVRARELGDVIALWYGEGDMVTPAFIRDAAKAALDEGLTFYIPNMRGHGAAERGAVRVPDAACTASTFRSRARPSRRAACRRSTSRSSLLVDTGTNVVYVAPQWPNIHNAIHLIGGEPRPFALDFDGDWRLDLDRLFATCDARTRAIFLSTPSNPTGWTATREEMSALLDFSRRTGIWIISDEVYGRLYFDGDVAPSILQVAEDGDRVLSVNSFSKAWAMTGWRIGWLTHPFGDSRPDRRDDPICQQRHRRRRSRPARSRPSGKASRWSRRSGSASRPGSTSPMTGSRRSPASCCRAKPRGGMYAFFALEGESDARRACADILEKAHVGLAPGHLFGQFGERVLAHVRLPRPRRRSQTALDRMLDTMN